MPGNDNSADPSEDLRPIALRQSVAGNARTTNAGLGNDSEAPTDEQGTASFSVGTNQEAPRDETIALGHRAARGTFVTLGGQGANLLVQMASVVILARLLTPSAYGLVAMVLAIVGVAQIFRDFGLSSAAIQAPKLSQDQRNNLFWLNTGIGCILALIIFLIAPLIQAIYHTENIATIARVLSITFILNGAATQFRADLNRRLDFLRLALADIVSSSIALAISVAIALAGGSYWALVAQQLVQGVVMLTLVAIAAGWIPQGWVRGTPLKSFITFGWNYVGAQLINYVANNLDSFLIGARFGAAPAGLYNRAFQLLMRPLTQLRAPSTTVALPTLSKLHDNEQRYGQYLLKGQGLLGYPITILMGFVAGAATPVTDLFLGSEWTSVAPILRWLTVAGAFQTLSFVGLWVYLSKGITNELRRYTLVSAGIRVSCVAVGVHWGVTGVAAGYGIGPLLAWPLAMWWLNRKVSIPTSSLMIGGLRIIVVGAAIMACCGAISSETSTLAPILQLLLCTAATLAICAVFPLISTHYRHDGLQVATLARKGLSRGPKMHGRAAE